MLKELVKIANKLDSLGLTEEADVLDTLISKSAIMREGDDLDLDDEDILYSPYSEPEFHVYPEPPVDIEEVKKAFISQFKDSRDLDTLDVTSIEWSTEPSEYPHYKIKAMGTYRKYVYKFDDYFRDGPPAGRGKKIKKYPMNVDFWIEPEGDPYPRGTPVKGSDGKIYYFYGED